MESIKSTLRGAGVRRVGPLVSIRLSCGACRFEIAHRCTAPTVGGERAIPEDLETPTWCPLKKQAIAEAAEREVRQ